MACTDIVCGTGGWSGPKPGDPDNNSILSATPAYGGIDLSWTFPVTNEFAVSHINIFRGVVATPELATFRVKVAGNFFFDRIPANEVREYFYWIQFVSINGTYGEWIGPVSAVPMLSITETIAELSGKIDEGILGEALRSKLGQINLLQGDLADEINLRLTSDAAIATALSTVQSETAQAITYINNEITQREASDEALLDSVNTLAVGMGDNAAAIVAESLLRADLEAAVAIQMTTVQSSIDDAVAAVEVTMGTAITTLEGEVDSIGALYTAKVNVNGLIGGFGVFNDGTEVQAGFDVDTFWVGKATDKIKPFIIDNGVVYINEAAIHYITADKIRAGNIGVTEYIGSLDYVPGQAGWRVNGSGNVEFNNGTFRGALIAATGTFMGGVNTGSYTGYSWPAVGQGGAHLSSSGFLIGNYNGGGKYFQIVSGYGSGGDAAIYTNIPAYLEDLQVSTLKIGNNAVTVPVSATASNTNNVNTPWADFGGAKVVITLSFTVSNNSDTSLIYITRDGANLFPVTVTHPMVPISGTVNVVDVTTSVTYLDAPSAGSHYYGGYSYSGATSLRHVTIVAMGVKK